MNEAAATLEEELLKWAKEHKDDATDWLHELNQQKIRDLETLRPVSSKMKFHLYDLTVSLRNGGN